MSCLRSLKMKEVLGTRAFNLVGWALYPWQRGPNTTMKYYFKSAHVSQPNPSCMPICPLNTATRARWSFDQTLVTKKQRIRKDQILDGKKKWKRRDWYNGGSIQPSQEPKKRHWEEDTIDLESEQPYRALRASYKGIIPKINFSLAAAARQHRPS